MAVYSDSPFQSYPMIVPGSPIYLFGGFNDKVGPTVMQVSNVALTSNVATLTVQVTSGNIPANGSFISVQGTQNTSGLFNVTNVALTGVTINATTGAGTVTFALTHANVSSTADSGQAIVPQPVTYTSVSVNDKSIAVAIADSPQGKSIQGIGIEVNWATGTSAGTVAVQCANTRLDSEFQTVSSIVWPNTRYDPAGLTADFVRVQVTALSGATSIAVKAVIR